MSFACGASAPGARRGEFRIALPRRAPSLDLPVRRGNPTAEQAPKP